MALVLDSYKWLLVVRALAQTLWTLDDDRPRALAPQVGSIAAFIFGFGTGQIPHLLHIAQRAGYSSLPAGERSA
jgi:hypothetical protein